MQYFEAFLLKGVDIHTTIIITKDLSNIDLVNNPILKLYYTSLQDEEGTTPVQCGEGYVYTMPTVKLHEKA